MYQYDKREFDIGRVAQGAMSSIGANFPVFALLALMFSAAPQFALVLCQGLITTGALGPSGQAAIGAGSPLSWLLFIVFMIVAMIGTYLLQAAVVRGTVDHLNGRRTQFSDCLSTGLRFAAPLFGIALAAGIPTAIGFVLLVPGLLMMVMWVVAAPVAVIERKGVFGSMSRSSDLTLGNRWKVLGALLVYVIAMAVVLMVLGAVTSAVSLALDGPVGPWVDAVLQALIQGFLGLVGAAGVASLYYELRGLKDGVGPVELAAVFD